MGDERLARLAPSTDPHDVAQLLARDDRNGALPRDERRVSAARARRPAGRSSRRSPSRAARSKPLRLLALADFLDSVDETRARDPPRRRLVSAARSRSAAARRRSRARSRDVRDKIDPSGDVVDHASPELRSIRDRLRKQRTRLRGTLESYLRGKDTAKYLQDQVVTERNGRYVLVVKAEHRSGDSGHRARRVDERREPVSRAAQHGRDQQRHRRARGAGGRGGPPHPARADRRVPRAAGRPAAARSRRPTELDVLQARARFSAVDRRRRAGALDRRRVRAAGGAASAACKRARVPGRPIRRIDSAGRRVAAITGPNTGGKTVALKTAGPARADGAGRPAHSGRRRIAAAGVPVGLRRHRRRAVDRGQPEHVLGAHHQHRVDGPRACDCRRWCCSTKSGSGTDPIEGGALGVADRRSLPAARRDVVATSHYDALKTYASTTDGRHERGVRLRSPRRSRRPTS